MLDHIINMKRGDWMCFLGGMIAVPLMWLTFKVASFWIWYVVNATTMVT